MIYVDFFLQVFVHALAWSLAVGLTLVLIGSLLWAAVHAVIGVGR